MNKELYNVYQRPWFATALELDALIEQLQTIKNNLPAGRRCKVIGVTVPQAPFETPIVGLQTRSGMLEDMLGEHLNRFGGALTEVEIEEASADNEHQLEQAEVVYVLLGRPISPAPPKIYED